MIIMIFFARMPCFKLDESLVVSGSTDVSLFLHIMYKAKLCRNKIPYHRRLWCIRTQCSSDKSTQSLCLSKWSIFPSAPSQCIMRY